jgi:hypothetical protein
VIAEKAHAVVLSRSKTEPKSLRIQQIDPFVEIRGIDVLSAAVVVPQGNFRNSRFKQRVSRRIEFPCRLTSGNFPLLRSGQQSLVRDADHMVDAFQIAQQ